MRELLIRYLLGELDADERRDVQARLQSSPELQRELAHLKKCFASHQNDDCEAAVPPSGLAERTAGRVTGCGDLFDPSSADSSARFAAAGDPPAGILGWSLADLTVAGGVMLAVSMLIFPALRNSRDETRGRQCQENQRRLLVLNTSYAQDHGGLFPQILPNENAGMYVARLIMRGYALPDELEGLLVCPGSPFADKIRFEGVVFKLRNAAALRAMTASQLALVSAMMSPCYSYQFPYRVGRELFYIRDEKRSLAPVLADTSGDEPSKPMSRSHGKVVQVMFQGGRLMSLTSTMLPGGSDDMFHNDLGKVAAGVRRQDAVLAPSNATPNGLPAAQAE